MDRTKERGKGRAAPERETSEPLADERLMWRVRMNDDPQAFALIVGRWEGPIHGLCLRMCGDVHRAQDLAQETFARLFARRREYEPTGRLSTFLWRIALNLCYDELRKLKRRNESPLDADFEGRGEPMAGASPDILVAESEQAEAVRAALRQLSEPYRAVVVLRHYEGLKFREIADVLDIPEGTVKSRMAEGLSQLGRLLAPALKGKELCPEKNSKTILAV